MLLIIFSSVILLSFILTIFIEKIFIKTNIFIDTPSDRKVHANTVPTAGGLAIIFSFFIYIALLSKFYVIDTYSFLVLFFAITPIIIIGLIDDKNEVNVYIRLIVQFFSALLIIYYFQINNNIFDSYINQNSMILIISSLLLSVWLMNLFNFMDGIDAYAASECIFVSFSSALIAYVNNTDNLMFLYLTGIGLASFGFILRNWYPAKIFMGDTGSVTIGCIFAFFIFYSGSESVLSMYTWLILLSIFISDATYTLIVRIVTKKNVSKPHLTHAFHIISRKTTQLFTVKTMILINLLWVFPLAFMSNLLSNYHIIITFIAYLPLLIYLIKIGAGLENDTIK